MAFVYRADRIINSSTNDLPQNLGPGSYVAHQDYKYNRSAVPFNTQAARSVPKKESEILPGPGAYYFEQAGDGQKVVLQSGNSEVRILEVPKPQSNFKSSTKRFINQKIDYTPGPGTYIQVDVDSKTRDVRPVSHPQNPNIIDHLMKVNRYQSIPSIPFKNQVYGYSEKDNNELELNRNPDNLYTGLKQDKVGPGQYTLKDTFEMNKNRGAAWHKSKVAKLASSVSREKELIVGPGTYDHDAKLIPMYKLRPSVGFQSKSQRQFDTRKGQIAQQFIMNRLQNNQKNFMGKAVDENESEEIEFVDDTTPGPGHYNVNQNSLSSASTQSQFIKYKGDQPQCFGSKSKRFNDEMKVQPVGPGNYNVGVSLNRSSVAFKQPPFLSSNTRFETRVLEMRPGPQSYTVKQTLEDRLIQKIQRGPLGAFGSNQLRFIQKSEDDAPGPGQYEYVKELDGNQPVQSNFKSKTKRDAFQIGKDQIPPPGAYIIENYTIAKGAKIEEEEDPDLAIKKPPFNTGVARFKDAPIRKPDDDDDDELNAQVHNQKTINELFMKKPQKEAAFNVKSKRFNYNQKELPPGPGQYYDHKTNKWSKRTYNILFAEI